MSPLVILTLVIGDDYRENLSACLDSKRAYAQRHGYVYLQGDEKFWNRDRPISWSKVGFLRQVLAGLPEGGLVWLSDADVYITNQEVDFLSSVASLLPESKDMLMTFDSCGHINAGNILYRNTAWTRAFLERVDAAAADPHLLHHVWWENGAISKFFDEDASVRSKIEVTIDCRSFNGYIMGFEEKNHYVHMLLETLRVAYPDILQRFQELLNKKGGYPKAVLWQPGDLLVHFAGIYDSEHMRGLIQRIQRGEQPRLDMYNPRKEFGIKDAE
jgi:galactosyl transferase GMA12/MNN10 family